MEESSSSTQAPVVDINGNGKEDYREPEVLVPLAQRWLTRYRHTGLARAVRKVLGFFGL